MKNILAVLFILSFSIAPAHAQSAMSAPVVLELFTSQSCASCPDADKLLSELVAQPGVIALACHVTYFDTPRWQDSLSRDFCARRQGAYAKMMGRGNRVFTPQMIVNGAAQLNGADRAKVSQALATAGTQNIAPIDLTLDAGRMLMIRLPALTVPPAQQFRLRIFGYRKNHLERIRGGENAGRSVLYVNAAVSLQEAGRWQGQEQMLMLPLTGEPADGYAVLAEDPQTGRIVAAGKTTSY